MKYSLHLLQSFQATIPPKTAAQAGLLYRVTGLLGHRVTESENIDPVQACCARLGLTASTCSRSMGLLSGQCLNMHVMYRIPHWL